MGPNGKSRSVVAYWLGACSGARKSGRVIAGLPLLRAPARPSFLILTSCHRIRREGLGR